MVASDARSLTWLFCRVSWLKAVTASGVSCTKVLRRVAVTTMRSICSAAGFAASVAAASWAMAAPLPSKMNWAKVACARLRAMRIAFELLHCCCLMYSWLLMIT